MLNAFYSRATNNEIWFYIKMNILLIFWKYCIHEVLLRLGCSLHDPRQFLLAAGKTFVMQLVVPSKRRTLHYIHVSYSSYTSGDVSINYARDNVSAINICDPFLQPTVISYRCNCNIIRCKRIGADKSGFFKIVSNGLRSVSTVMCFPIV